MTKSLVMEKDVGLRAPNDWKKRFDKNFLNSVLPTSWKLQSLGAMVADSRIYESSGTGSTQQKHFELLN